MAEIDIRLIPRSNRKSTGGPANRNYRSKDCIKDIKAIISIPLKRRALVIPIILDADGIGHNESRVEPLWRKDERRRGVYSQASKLRCLGANISNIG